MLRIISSTTLLAGLALLPCCLYKCCMLSCFLCTKDQMAENEFLETVPSHMKTKTVDISILLLWLCEMTGISWMENIFIVLIRAKFTAVVLVRVITSHSSLWIVLVVEGAALQVATSASISSSTTSTSGLSVTLIVSWRILFSTRLDELRDPWGDFWVVLATFNLL